MTKRNFLFTISIVVMISWMSGCSSLPGIKNRPTSKKQAGTLYSSVPSAMRAPVKEATFDLKQATANLALANEKVKLAELKKERATVAKKQADHQKKLAETLLKKAEITIERKKMEAIDNANLGDKAANIKKVADLRTKELGIESDAVKTQAVVSTLELDIKKLNKKIMRQEKRVKGKK